MARLTRQDRISSDESILFTSEGIVVVVEDAEPGGAKFGRG